MTDAAGNRRKLIIFTEPRDTLDLPRRQDPHPPRPRRGRGRDPRRARPRGAAQRHRRLPARPGGAGDGRERRRRRGRQPPARPPHGQLRPALEPQPPRAALRPHPPHRPDRGLPPLEPGRRTRPARARSTPACWRSSRRRARRSAAGSTTCSASCSSSSALRDLLIEAIRYGEQPEVKARLLQAVDDAADHAHLLELLERRALTQETLPFSRVQAIREQMERAHAQRLQPHYIESFFREAFEHLGGRITAREDGRFEITRVPGALRERDRQIGTRRAGARRATSASASTRRTIAGPPVAAFVCPGHPLLDATIDLTLERHRDLMKQGAVLVDPRDQGDAPARPRHPGPGDPGRPRRPPRPATRSSPSGSSSSSWSRTAPPRDAGPAPYLDYRPARRGRARGDRTAARGALARRATSRAGRSATPSQHLVPRELDEVRARRLPRSTRSSARSGPGSSARSTTGTAAPRS